MPWDYRMKYRVTIVAHNDNSEKGGRYEATYLKSQFLFMLFEVNKYIYNYIIEPGTEITKISIKLVDQ